VIAEAPPMMVRGRDTRTRRIVPISTVSASYFSVMRQPMMQGRGFADVAGTAAIRPLVISDALARVWWGDAPAIGAELETADGRRFEVTGVVHADVAFSAGTADSIMAFALAPPAPTHGVFFIRFEGDASTVKPAVHAVLRAMTPLAATVPTTLAAADAESASKFMPLVRMVGSLGVTAIALALVGIYGVVSFAVARRTREIGVRIALGASRRDIVRLILATGAPPVAIGIGAGLVLVIPAAIALARVFEYTPVPLHAGDPAPYAIVAIVLTLVAFVTMLVPARRACAVPPSVALRTE
jgi:putative ABC transport system permease protein